MRIHSSVIIAKLISAIFMTKYLIQGTIIVIIVDTTLPYLSIIGLKIFEHQIIGAINGPSCIHVWQLNFKLFADLVMIYSTCEEKLNI